MQVLKFLYQLIHIILILTLVIIVSNILSGCANIVPPSGGPKDTIAPKLLSIQPSDSVLNTKVKKLEMVFDKYMVLGDQSQLIISPSIELPPMVEVKMKKVILTFTDTAFSENTTYNISFGNMLKDNREGIEFADYHYTFSTGDYFDSLSIRGFAFNAQNVSIDTGLKAVLYLDEDFSDSQVFYKKPLYMSPVAPDGTFTFNYLPQKAFRLFVIKDDNKNNLYDPGKEMIGFLDHAVSPEFQPDTVYTLRYFQETRDSVDITQTTAEDEQQDGGRINSRNRNQKPDATANWAEDELYRVLVDTQQQHRGTQEITEALKIRCKPLIKTIQKDKIFLSFEKEMVDIEAIHHLDISDTAILIQTDWQEESTYTLRLVKGWAVDTAGNEVPPGKYVFKTKKENDYGSIKLLFQDSFTQGQYLIQLFREKDSVSLLPIQDSIMSWKLLLPGSYQFFMIQDIDQNGSWTTGDYLKKRQAEWTFKNPEIMQLKAGWEMEENFKPESTPSIRSSKRIGSRSGARDDENQE